MKTNKPNIERINSLIWANSLIILLEEHSTLGMDEIEWINDAVKHRLNRYFRIS